MKAGAFTDAKVVELSRSFECAYVEIKKNFEQWSRFAACGRLDVRFFSPEGSEISRMAFQSIYTKGDPERLAQEMTWVLKDSKRANPGDIVIPVEGRELIGRDLPEWEPDEWLDRKPLKLRDLAGNVVLITFFYTDRHGTASMPAMQALQKKYQEKGLRVVGFYNLHILREAFGPGYREEIIRALDSWGATFPVGLDISQKTLDKCWVGSPRSSRNVTFLLDRKGKVRYLHPGPELHPADQNGKCSLRAKECNRHFADLEHAIGKLLEE